MNNIIKINPDKPEPEIIAKAADIIKNNGSVVFPTTCLYGLGVNAFNQDAVKSIFSIKQRAPEKPISLLVKDKTDVNKLAQDISLQALKIMDRFWPGKVTIVFSAKKIVSVDLTAGTGKIGLRMPAHKVAAAFLSAAKSPITATSANISGGPGCSNIDELDSSIIKKVDLILDAGKLVGGAGSTVVDVTVDPPKILRKGSYNLIFEKYGLS